MPKTPLNTQSFIDKSIIIHNGKYTYDKVIYVNYTFNVIITCPVHGDFLQPPQRHLKGNGCKKCAIALVAGANKSNTAEFIKKANIVHNFQYNYEKVIYTNNSTKVEIICFKHGSFLQAPASHLAGHGCDDCAKELLSQKFMGNKDEFVKNANIIHNNKYNYDKVIYQGNKVKIEITCLEHGEFWQTPANHLSGYGCWECGGSFPLTTEIFIQRAGVIHNNKYSYELVDYKSVHVNVLITCSAHGSFPQTPAAHLSGAGCPTCIHIISKPEISWLNSLGLPNDESHRQVRLKELGRIKVDGYDPITNTIFEFHGDYFHGNINKFSPDDINQKVNKTFGQLYKETIERENIIKSAGYNLVVMWESDWKQMQKELKEKK